jgi:hypothetical protein
LDLRKRNVGVAACALVAIIASVAGLFNAFCSDDIPIILDDARVHSLASAWRLAFTTSYWPPPWPAELYRPLSTIAYAFQYVAAGGWPVTFHVVSYLLYAASAVAVFLLARRLLPAPIALGVGLLFAAHPVHVEAVAMAVNQSEIVVGLLAAVAVTCYVDARRGAATLGARAWTLVILCCVTAALTKETGLVVPGLLAGAELCLIDDASLAARARRLWPGYALLACCDVAVMAARAAVLRGAVGALSAEALVGLDLRGRALTMLQVVPRWTRLLAWPAHLQADYAPREIVGVTHLDGAGLVGLALLAGATALAYWARRRAPVVTFGLVWCAVALFPVSNVLVPTGVVLAERTLFLPSIGFLLAVGGAVAYASEHVARLREPRWREAMATACAALVCVGVWRSDRRERDWQNQLVLWYRTALDAPNSYRAQRGLGWVMFQVGRPELAIQAYARSIADAPVPWKIRNELAEELRDRGQDSLALPQLEASVSENPNQPTAYAALIADLIAVGRYADAARLAARESHDGGAATTQRVFRGLAGVADSAGRAHAPPGTVRLHVLTTPVRGGYASP